MTDARTSTPLLDGARRRDLLSAAADSSPDAVVTIDRDGVVTSLNAAGERMFGWTEQELLGRPAASLVPADKAQEASDLERGLPGLLTDQTYETERLHRSGRRVRVALRAAPLYQDGRRIGSVAVLRDMSAELAVRRELGHARRLAESRFEQSVFPLASMSPDGTVLEVNDVLLAVSGYTAQQVVGHSFTEFMLPTQVDDAAANQAKVREGDLDWVRTHRLLRKADGTLLETVVSLSALRDDAGAVLRLEVAIEDVSAVLSAERELRASESRWRALALRSADVAFLADADGALSFVTPSISEHFGHSDEDVMGKSGFDFFHPDDLPSVQAEWRRAVAMVGTPVTFRARVQHADGSWRWVQETATNWLSDPDIGAVVANVVDITALVHAERRLSTVEATDVMTGLGTRTAVLAELERTTAAGAAPALLVVDVDDFREVNAAYGHPVGDDVLAAFAHLLTDAVDGGSVVGRLAGDRFAVLLPGAVDEELLEVARRLSLAAQTPLAVPDGSVSLTAGTGVVPAGHVAAADDAAGALALAELALGEAKKRGGGQVHVHDGSQRLPLADRVRTVAELRHALQSSALVTHYQPVMALDTGRAVGAEALVRWQHPDRGLLAPAQFLAAAESSGLITELGAQVLDHACRTAAAWADQKLFAGPFTIAVNLSARQMGQRDIVDLVRDTLAATGARPGSLVLEVTESVVMDDMDTTDVVLEELRALGVGIAIDDFGTGYSSLTYLRRFPVTAVKVDQSFVAGLGLDQDDDAIVTSVVQLASAIGLDCIAEGVETLTQANLLRRAGCAYGQGYLWSPPLPAAEVTGWLRALRSAPPVPAGPDQAQPPRRSPRERTPVTTVVLQRIAELEADGASLTTIAAALNAEGLVTPDGRRWHPRSIARVIADEARARTG